LAGGKDPILMLNKFFGMEKQSPFWRTKSLENMNKEEWESLCDGCAVCCLQRLKDRHTGKILTSSVSCRYLDIDTCRCTVYEKRTIVNPHCTKLTFKNLEQKKWLPPTCAYVSIAEGRDLEWWHPLVSGDPETVHEAGISLRDKALSGKFVHPDDLSHYVESTN